MCPPLTGRGSRLAGSAAEEGWGGICSRPLWSSLRPRRGGPRPGAQMSRCREKPVSGAASLPSRTDAQGRRALIPGVLGAPAGMEPSAHPQTL